MELETFQYIQDEGWSVKKFPDLDSENTLVLAFAAPDFIDNPEPFKELAKQYPKSKIIGCSSAGEIAGAFIHDKSISVAVARFQHTKIVIATAEISRPEDSRQVGEKIAKTLEKK